MSISNYFIKFEQLHEIAKSHKIEVLDGVFVYRLLNNTNLPEEEKKLVWAKVNNMKHRIMKEQLKKFFNSLSLENAVERKQ